MVRLKMGTRGSALARAQSGQLLERFRELVPGLEFETVVIRTSGDRFAAENPNRPPVAGENTKGLFVKEIEEALVRGEIDFAVHSAKDLPAELHPELTIAAYPRREDPRDAFIGRGGAKLAELKAGCVVASASLRRQVQLLALRPDLRVTALRGNVDTRLRKLEEGRCDGLLLACAGLIRLGRLAAATEIVEIDAIVPAPAQGALAVETRAQGEAAALCARLDDAPTRLEVEFERALLKALGGGCTTPLGALARAEGCGVEMTAFWADPDGRRSRRLTQRCPDARARDVFIADLAARLRE